MAWNTKIGHWLNHLTWCFFIIFCLFLKHIWLKCLNVIEFELWSVETEKQRKLITKSKFLKVSHAVCPANAIKLQKINLFFGLRLLMNWNLMTQYIRMVVEFRLFSSEAVGSLQERREWFGGHIQFITEVLMHSKYFR